MNSDEITKRFFESTPSVEEEHAIENVSIAFGNLALSMNKLLPDSREKKLVLTKLEEAKFFASAAIVRRT